MDATRRCLKFGRFVVRVAQKPHRAFHLLRAPVFLGIDSTRPFYFAVQQLSIMVRLE
jgi:hypothetical protein